MPLNSGSQSRCTIIRYFGYCGTDVLWLMCYAPQILSSLQIYHEQKFWIFQCRCTMPFKFIFAVKTMHIQMFWHFSIDVKWPSNVMFVVQMYHIQIFQIFWCGCTMNFNFFPLIWTCHNQDLWIFWYEFTVHFKVCFLSTLQMDNCQGFCLFWCACTINTNFIL